MTQVAGTKTASGRYSFTMRSSTVARKPLKHQNRHLKINYVHIIYFFDRCLDVVDLVVMKLEEGVVHIEVVADSVRSIRTSTKSCIESMQACSKQSISFHNQYLQYFQCTNTL